MAGKNEAELERRVKPVQLQRIYNDDLFEQSFNAIREKLKNWERQYHSYTNLRIEKNYSWGADDGYWYLMGDTLESDEEFEKRKAKAAKECARRKEQTAKARIKKEEQDRKEYERLKKKFEE